ncbi:hypothetical protein [Sphingomonas crocodyli]|uniref:Uncharacterized protein n=1 Tax=Sphingomonas crocodyli TaxID=1979270 RepID=A0A437LY69_9SPHN|nr:hypothetical protein [Sphingomonas crocodyli]RVT90350.1 hypothetical protein EOD43_18970 [Sphingomonas crocodyli]
MTDNRVYVEGRRSNGATVGIVVAVVAVLAVIAAFAFGLIDINQTKDTKLPDVSVSGGQAPAFDVDTAKVDVGTKKTDVTVPKVEVGTTKADVEVPTVDIKKAD